MTALARARPADALVSDMAECNYPTREHHHRLDCGQRSVAVYVLAPGAFLPRCVRHDGPKTRAYAEEMGAQRIPIGEWQG